MRSAAVASVLAFASLLVAEEAKVRRGVAYAGPKDERRTLDVYAEAKGKDRPVVLWIHGGGWRKGDKADVRKKPQAFVDKGYVFVSINYRLVPDVSVKEMAGDVAKAIRWVHDHAGEYGGDPKSLFVMGHSAGAHLAALVCTDDRYLRAEGLPLSVIRGCVPVDASVYDVPKRMKDGGSVPKETLQEVFGKTEESQRDLSPVTHVARGKDVPPFLILHVAGRAETKTQSRWLAGKLKDAGVPAEVVAAEGTTHATINSNLGLKADKPTLKVWEFMATSLKGAAAALAEQVGKLKKLGARITLDRQGRVVEVNLGERKVADADLIHLRGFHHLRELDLTRTKVTGAGLKHLEDLTSLRRLFLTDTKVDDAGVSHLKGMKTLVLIGLSGTRISDAAVDHLREMNGLEQVFCLGTGLTDDGAKKLRRALPKCEITR
jgi:acetyl esterase/lipase